MAITVAMRTQVSQLYVSLFGRAPDGEGLGFWVTALDSGKTLAQVAQEMYITTPARAYYPAFATNGEIISTFYQNVLGRAADAEGLAFWTAELNKAATKGEVFAKLIANVVDYTGTDAAGLKSQSLLKNKVEAAQYYGEKNGSIAGATAVLAGVTEVATTVTAAKAIADGASAAGQSFTLVTGVDTITGTTGNDTINGVLSATAASNTLNSFDNVNGGAGTDTLNLAVSLGSATGPVSGNFSIPAGVTFAGLENVNVSQTAAAGSLGTGALTVTNSTFGTGVQKFSYSDASLTTDMTAAAVAVTLASATDVTVASVGTGSFTTVAVTDTAATITTGSTLKNVSVTKATGALTLTGNGITNVTLNATGGLTTVTAASGTRELTVNTAGTTALGGLTDATATTLNINVAGAAALGTFTAAKATTVNYSSTAANTSGTLTAALATTLNVAGTKLATLTMAGNTVLATVNVTGSAGLTTDLTAGATAVTLLDTSGTTGIATVTVNNGTAVTGGAGNDNISVGATTKAINLGGSTAVAAVTGSSIAIPAANKVTLTAGTTALGTGGSINGGTGSADVLSMVAADAVTLSTAGAVQTAFKAAVTGFEVLELAALGADSTVDAKGLGSTFNQVNVTGAAQTLTIRNLSNNDTVQITGANTGVTTAGSSGAGVDALNIRLVNSTNAALNFGTVTAGNTETVNVISTDAQVTPTGVFNQLTIVDASASTINVSGNSGLALTFAGTALTSLDASAVTLSGITYTSGALQYASVAKGTVKGGDTLNFAAALAAVTITETAGTNSITGSSTVGSTLTGGSGADTIVGGAGVDTISGGAGADVITGAAGKDVITLGAGADIVRYNTIATSAAAAGAQMDTITDFVAGTDKINLAQGALSLTGVTTDGTGDATATMAAPVAIATSVATLAEVYAALAAAAALTASAADGTATVAQIYTLANGASAGTYLVINDATAGFQAATDIVINLTGLSGTFAGTDITYTV